MDDHNTQQFPSPLLKESNKMLIVFIAIIVGSGALIAFFFPKDNGTTGTHVSDMEPCPCIGFGVADEPTKEGSTNWTCYGIPVSCR